MLILPIAAGIAHEEALDALDPFRCMMAVNPHTASSNHNDVQSHVLLPAQRPSVTAQTIQLDFPRSEGGPICVHLAVDASPGCGGVAWAAGMASLFTVTIQLHISQDKLGSTL